jgi:hypothetical protein
VETVQTVDMWRLNCCSLLALPLNKLRLIATQYHWRVANVMGVDIWAMRGESELGSVGVNLLVNLRHRHLGHHVPTLPCWARCLEIGISLNAI